MTPLPCKSVNPTPLLRNCWCEEWFCVWVILVLWFFLIFFYSIMITLWFFERFELCFRVTLICMYAISKSTTWNKGIKKNIYIYFFFSSGFDCFVCFILGFFNSSFILLSWSGFVGIFCLVFIVMIFNFSLEWFCFFRIRIVYQNIKIILFV